jgi:DNA-binding GntR family transcriptional regulator
MTQEPPTAKAESVVRGSDETYRTIRKAIIAERINQWTGVVEEDLAREFHLSRSPVREALRRLEHDGLVRRLRRAMLVAAPITDEDRHDIHLVRLEIDRLAARLACQRAQPENWEAARAAVARMGLALKAEGMASTAFAVAHLDVHAAINRVAFRGQLTNFITAPHHVHRYRRQRRRPTTGLPTRRTASDSHR